MPILRLVLIYLALIVAVLAVFNRDKLGRLVFGGPPAEHAVAAPMAPAAPAPVSPAAPAQPAQPGIQEPSAPLYPPASFDPEHTAVAPAPQPAPAPTPAPAPGPGTLQTPTAAPGAAPQAPAPAAAAPAAQAPVATSEPDLAAALNAARSAYWAGDMDGAGAQLAALAAAHPDNPDLLGELGNFRFAQRDYAGAAEAFLRAGELLVDQGRAAQAATLMPILGQIAPDKAQTLATRLQNR